MALDPAIISQLVSTGEGIITGVLSTIMNSKALKQNKALTYQQWKENAKQANQQFSYDMEALKRQQDYNTEMWNKTNQYNSPQMQMQRYKEAGLNPNLVGGYAPYTPNPLTQSMPVAKQATAKNFSGLSQAFTNYFQGIPESLTKGQAAYYKRIEKQTNDVKLSLAQQNLEIAKARLNDYFLTSELGRQVTKQKLSQSEKLFESKLSYEKAKAAIAQWNLKMQPYQLQKLIEQIDGLHISNEMKSYTLLHILPKQATNLGLKNENLKIQNEHLGELLTEQIKALQSKTGLTDTQKQFQDALLNEYKSPWHTYYRREQAKWNAKLTKRKYKWLPVQYIGNKIMGLID